MKFKLIGLIMRLTTVILIASLMQVSAAGLAQNFSMKANNASLKQVFDEIKKQTGYAVLARTDQINKAGAVSVDLKNVPLATALQEILKDKNLEFSIEDKVIVIKEKTPSFLDNLVASFTAIDVRGKVIGENDEVLVGATVKVKGGNNSATTNTQGEFYLRNVDEDAIIVISYLGYVSMELKAGKDMGTIKLVMGSSNLEEVTINKGYYSTTKALNTGNVSMVTAKDIERQPVTDPMLALQGRVPGLFVQQTTGVPGRENVIQLRGQNSIANGNSPLFIVDGIPYDSKSPTVNPQVGTFATPLGNSASPFNFLNPSDIESIEVLKDGDATAIYGSRGANGVILITTKRGNAGKTQIDVNFSSSVEKAVRRTDLMNTQQYLQMRKEYIANTGQTIQPADYDLNGTWDQNRYTDWQDYFIGNSSTMTNASIVLSGGSQLTNFRVSTSYRKQGTIFPGDFGSNMASAQFSVNHHSIDERFSMQLSGSYSNASNDLPKNDTRTFMFLAPNLPKLYNDDGTLNWENDTFVNPMAGYEIDIKESSRNLIGGLMLGYSPLKNLNIKGNFAYSALDFGQTNLTPLSASSPTSIRNQINAGRSINDLRLHSFSTRRSTNWNIEPQVSYQFNLFGGKIESLIGTTFLSTTGKYLSMLGTGYNSDLLLKDYTSAANVTKLSSGSSEYRYSAIYSRIGYSYLDKYIANFTLRRDGSSRYGEANKFGNFGSVGAAWIFTKENLFKRLSWLSFGKIRSSYAVTGNDQFEDYAYLDTYSSNTLTYQGVNGLRPSQLSNAYFGWERVNKAEFGLELGFLNNRLNLNTSYYLNKTKNQLVSYALPSVAGFSTVRANIPAVIRNSGLELEFNSVNIKTKNFNWKTSANISFPRNKLVAYPNIESSSYARTYIVGQPLSLRFLYHYIGIDPQNGLFQFQDKNEDGQISSTLDRFGVFVGQDFYGGLQNNFRWKGIELDVFIQFTKQNGINYYPNAAGAFSAGQGNILYLGDKSNVLSPYSATKSFALGTFSNNSDGVVMDASFVKLKNVSIGYQLPLGQLLNKIIKSAGIYVSGQNLFTLSKYQGFDPESQGPILSSTFISGLRVISGQLRVSF